MCHFGADFELNQSVTALDVDRSCIRRRNEGQETAVTAGRADEVRNRLSPHPFPLQTPVVVLSLY